MSHPQEEIFDDTETPDNIPKTVNRLYFLIIGAPFLTYSLILLFLTIFIPLEPLAGGWEIWIYMFSIPGLAFIGGFFLKKEELQKSILYSILVFVAYTALVTSALSGSLEIIRGVSTNLQIFFAFLGGILYGGAFALIDGLLLILATFGAFYLKQVIQNRRKTEE